MKRKTAGFLVLAAFGLVALLLYYGRYELRLVPNEPHLRPELKEPSPGELDARFMLAGGPERDNRGFPQRRIVDLASLFPNLFLREGPQKIKKVALTFDDGPDSVYTPQILDILNAEKVKGTFFLIGNRARLFPAVVKRMVKEGHVVGNHSMTHPNIAKLKPEQVKKELLEAESALKNLIGYRTALFRSPYGSLEPETVKLIASYGYKVIAWNVDSLDWKSLSAEQVKYNILENVKEGSIILQHSSGSEKENLTGTVGALRDVIKTLKKEGYEFVTVPQLLNIPYKK
ncbi:MAG: polysaccharide deacetylase family protein [Peptococcaceae bacterium]|jgi:polysaccharide deacetylase family sporulation protein PdaB|nr:polysaccharide deacetylase family protein [Peptococcaceae bacterium]MDH7524892.1 polysaccharide deacetylase family protein [Peptococcaceae bacterium]